MTDKTSLIRKLVPKSYHFDGYNELNCPNSRDKPFFSDNVIPMGGYYLTIRYAQDSISLEYASICPNGKIAFEPYQLNLKAYVSKLQKAVQNGSDFITFEIIPRYWINSDFCKKCSLKNPDCMQIRESRPKQIIAAVSFNTSEVKEALATYFEITNKNQNGGINMKKSNNNILGMNFELGLSKDPNIASTLMGVAVRNPKTGNWYTFDVARDTRKNLANIKMGSFPIMLLPTKVLVIGDLIKLDGDYYYVKNVNPGAITLIGAADGVIREVLPEESIIPGMTLYTKVVAFDTNSLMSSSKEDVSGNLLAAVCMMQWANGNGDEFSLDNIQDDSFNGLGAYLPLILASGGNNFSNMLTGDNGSINLPALIALGAGGNSDSNDMAQMMVVSQLLGNNSPFSSVIPANSQSAEAGVICTKCGATFPEGTNFCTKCGSKTKTIESSKVQVVCEKCGNTYPDGTNFCPKCGGKTKEISTTCRKCGATLMEGAVFCHKCGARTIQDTCPNCGRLIDDDQSFCPGCGKALNETSPVSEPATEPKKEENAETSSEEK